MKYLERIIGICLMLLVTAGCSKNQPQTHSVIPTSPEETEKLLVGNWIEDSLNIQNTITFAFTAPSYLNVNSSLNYRMVQTSPLASQGNDLDASDTGQFTNISTRYITPSSFYGNQDYLGSFGPMQIDTLTAHRMVLFGYGDLVPPTFYFHK
jgi:hypothetical protein